MILLTFGELEPLTSASQTVLLTLSLTRIASEEANNFEVMAIALVFLNKCAGDAESCCNSLSLDPAASNANENVVALRAGDFGEGR